MKKVGLFIIVMIMFIGGVKADVLGLFLNFNKVSYDVNSNTIVVRIGVEPYMVCEDAAFLNYHSESVSFKSAKLLDNEKATIEIKDFNDLGFLYLNYSEPCDNFEQKTNEIILEFDVIEKDDMIFNLTPFAHYYSPMDDMGTVIQGENAVFLFKDETEAKIKSIDEYNREMAEYEEKACKIRYGVPEDDEKDNNDDIENNFDNDEKEPISSNNNSTKDIKEIVLYSSLGINVILLIVVIIKCLKKPKVIS